MRRRPAFVPVKLRDLAIGAEFITTLTRRRGVVSDTGWVPWEDGAGRTTRLRSVLVRYANGAERIHRADMEVLVDAATRHARFAPAEEARRWTEPLRDPDSVSTVGELVRAKPRGLVC